MRKTVMLCMAAILAGCSQPKGQSTDPVTESNFVYDERDSIPTDVPLPRPGINQRPVVGDKKVLVSIVHWSDGDILNDGLNNLFTLSPDPNSLRSYIQAASGGKLTLGGQVISHTSGPRPDICKTGSPMPFELARSEGEKAARAKGLDPANFDFLINIIECGGNAEAQTPGKIMGVYGQAGSPHVFKHEFGHNLGYAHGQSYTKCPKNGPVVQSPTGCTTVGYGDTGDSVSGGATLYPAINRWYSGWLDSSQVGVIESSGLYRLGVLGGEGPQVYLVNRPGLAPAQLTLEYRKPTSFDNFPPNDNRVNGVWARYTTTGGSVHNIQLDATPETSSTSDPTLIKNRTLADDAAGFVVYVCSTSADGATISVGVGQGWPSCGLLIPLPTIETPAIGAPVTSNPIVFSGTARPGAKVGTTYTSDEGSQSIDTIADATGKWQLTLPPLPPGKYSSLTLQTIGLGTSLSIPRNFEVAP